MRVYILGSGVLLAIGIVAGGCGGTATSDNLFGSGQNTGGSGQGGGQAAVGGSTSATTTSGVTTTGATTTGVTTGATTTGATTTGATTSSGGFMPNGVYCHDEPCAVGEICCAHFWQGSQDHCAPPGSCGENFAAITCNEQVDCPGQICCGAWSNQISFYTDVSCKDTCEGNNSRIMCFGDPSVCPGGTDCEDSSIGDGYMYCD